jgi:hypothetical protein
VRLVTCPGCGAAVRTGSGDSWPRQLDGSERSARKWGACASFASRSYALCRRAYPRWKTSRLVA